MHFLYLYFLCQYFLYLYFLCQYFRTSLISVGGVDVVVDECDVVVVVDVSAVVVVVVIVVVVPINQCVGH